LKAELVSRIVMRFGDISGFTLGEFDSTGEVIPFAGDIWSTTDTTPSI
jgi:hypothetical protein